MKAYRFSFILIAITGGMCLTSMALMLVKQRYEMAVIFAALFVVTQGLVFAIYKAVRIGKGDKDEVR